MHNKPDMEAIPFKFLSHSTRYQLANKLDPRALMGDNWRLLAEKLGYTNEQMDVSINSHWGTNCLVVLVLTGDILEQTVW